MAFQKIKKFISCSTLIIAHWGYNNGSPGERLQNRETNDNLKDGEIKRRQRKRKSSVIKSKNELGKYGL